MKAGIAIALMALSAGAAQAGRPPIRLSANPSAVVAEEIAFNQLAQNKGQWTAFRATAAKDAVMFVPEQVNAQSWLNGRKDPPASVKWAPEKVLMSCDGSVGVTTGGWQRPNGSVGYFTTIWRRDTKGRWKWVLDHGDTLASPRPVSDMIATRIAPCPKGMRAPVPVAVATPVPPPGTGQSEDGTLRWAAVVAPDKSRVLTVTLRIDDRDDIVLRDAVGAPRP